MACLTLCTSETYSAMHMAADSYHSCLDVHTTQQPLSVLVVLYCRLLQGLPLMCGCSCLKLCCAQLVKFAVRALARNACVHCWLQHRLLSCMRWTANSSCSSGSWALSSW